jgi:hypothetical protein
MSVSNHRRSIVLLLLINIVRSTLLLLLLLLLPSAFTSTSVVVCWRPSTLSTPLLLSPYLVWCILLLLWLQLAAWVVLLLPCASMSFSSLRRGIVLIIIINIVRSTLLCR